MRLPRLIYYAGSLMLGLLTLRAGGVLPEWRPIVRHHRAGDVRAAIAAAGLELERRQSFGPKLAPKWHLWWTRARS